MATETKKTLKYFLEVIFSLLGLVIYVTVFFPGVMFYASDVFQDGWDWMFFIGFSLPPTLAGYVLYKRGNLMAATLLWLPLLLVIILYLRGITGI